MSFLDRKDIKSLFPQEVEAELAALGQPKFRAKQIVSWLHEKRVTSFEEMTNIPHPQRKR